MAPKGRLAAIITETEAYLGVKDKACHSFGGRTTPRVQSMYLEGGHAYIYKIYGLHFCLNVVTRKAGDPQAVLIRAARPIFGEEIMRKNRGPRHSLTDGPGKLCQAFGLTKAQDAWDLLISPLQIYESDSRGHFPVRTTPRIGIDYAEDWTHRKLRYLSL